ncbi:MAG: hypothetical protein SPL49_09660, partial [Oribacterium sp.]|nr:hypothetical protein [Oribacterium sp.]
MKINTKKFLHKTVAATTILCCLTENVLFTPIAYAGQAKAGVEETLYLNLDYYGEVSAANMVKAITFNGTDSYTDYGDYSSIINMTDDQKLTSKDGKVVIQAPTNSTKLYFQGAMDKAKAAAQLPWTFDISYKLNGKPVNADTLSGASGLVEIDIDATANKNVAEYLQNNIVLAVMVPVDMEKNYSLDAPDAQTANMGDKSGVVFTCLPGQDGHFEVRIGSDDFKLYGVMFVMSPITVSDLDKVKDLKDLEDRFRGDTNSMMDSFDDILDDVANMQSQLDLTDKALKELQSGKNKVHSNATAIFNGTDVAIQDLRDLSGVLSPLSDDLKTAQWMVYDINANLNTTNEDLADASSKLKNLSKRFKQFGEDLDGASTISNLDVQDMSDDIKKTVKALEKVNNNVKTTSKIVATPSQIVEDVGKAETATITTKIVPVAMTEARLTADEQSLLGKYLSNNSDTTIDSSAISDLAALLGVADVTTYPDDSDDKKLEYLDYIKKNKAILIKAAQDKATAEAQIAALNGDAKTAAEKALQAKEEATKKAFETSTKLKYDNLQTYATAALTAQQSSSAKYTKAQTFVTSLPKQRIDGSASGTTTTSDAKTVAEAKQDLEDMKTTADNLKKTDSGTAMTDLANSIYDLSDSLQAYYDENGDGSEEAEDLIDAIDSVSSSLTEIAESGGALSFQAARVTNNIRDLIGDMDSLIGIMNAYYGDVQKTIEDGDNLIVEIQKTSNDTASVLQTVNNTLRSAEPDFSAAADDSISLGHEAVENGSNMIDHTTELKETGHGLRDAINDKLDEEEADNNFINMDPDAPKVSLTSSENQEPTNISIVCRSDEIKSAEEAESLDSEVDAAGTTFWQ